MPGRTNWIGRHLPTSGGLGKTLRIASELGCETAQIFVSNPQGWEGAPTHVVPILTVVAAQCDRAAKNEEAQLAT